ncbi:MAG TPA: hypothetical protein VES00_06215, partial [Burkholderiaceae bacterium]|nr:hypothetical protein [Burkholderiaceae bacterium]
MQIDDAAPQGGPESEYLWLREGDAPHPGEDRITEVVALIALLFSLSIGLVIALLPVSAVAAATTQASLEPSGLRIVP